MIGCWKPETPAWRAKIAGQESVWPCLTQQLSMNPESTDAPTATNLVKSACAAAGEAETARASARATRRVFFMVFTGHPLRRTSAG